MFKGIAFLTFSCVSIFAQVQYNPATGEPIDQKKYNPNTGEEIEQRYDPNTGKSLEVKKGGMTAKIVLTTGSIIQGKLVSQDREKIILESQAAGTLSIDRAKIEKITISGVPMFFGRSASAPATKESASTDNASRFQDLSLRAKSEAAMKNNRLINTAIGTGACLNPIPYITLPLMGLGIIGNVGVPEPESKFYKDLDLRLKTQYNKIYFKEIKKLRSQQCYAPTLTAVAMLGIIIFTNL